MGPMRYLDSSPDALADRAGQDLHTVLARRLPEQGPYEPDRTCEAARGLDELVGYLAAATAHGQAVPDTDTVNIVLRGLGAAARCHGPLLEHLSQFVDDRAHEPTLRDDRADRDPRDTATELATVLREADQAAHTLATHLSEATALTGHLTAHPAPDTADTTDDTHAGRAELATDPEAVATGPGLSDPPPGNRPPPDPVSTLDGLEERVLGHRQDQIRERGSAPTDTDPQDPGPEGHPAGDDPTSDQDSVGGERSGTAGTGTNLEPPA